MWATQLSWKDGQNWVTLSRDGAVVAVVSLDDWADLSATKLLTDNVRSELQHEINRAAHGL